LAAESAPAPRKHPARRSKPMRKLPRQALGVVLLSFIFAATALAQHEQAFSFNGTNGSSPTSGLIADAAGNLYGVTPYGGPNNSGVVYEFTPPSSPGAQWTEATIYAFEDTPHGPPTRAVWCWIMQAISTGRPRLAEPPAAAEPCTNFPRHPSRAANGPRPFSTASVPLCPQTARDQ
jgi:uncharacterized repeat protein (TIGR03803 family)